MIYFTENENENGKIDHINKTYIHVDREKNVQNIVSLGKTVSKLSNTEAELKKILLTKEACSY